MPSSEKHHVVPSVLRLKAHTRQAVTHVATSVQICFCASGWDKTHICGKQQAAHGACSSDRFWSNFCCVLLELRGGEWHDDSKMSAGMVLGHGFTTCHSAHAGCRLVRTCATHMKEVLATWSRQKPSDVDLLILEVQKYPCLYNPIPFARLGPQLLCCGTYMQRICRHKNREVYTGSS